MHMLYRVLRILIIFLILLGLFSLFFIKIVDRSDYQSSDFYKKMTQRLDSIDREDYKSVGDTIKVGWAKSSLIPDFQLPLAGFEKRKGQKFTGIKDSIWVKTFVIDNGIRKLAFITLDLLIVPPDVTQMVLHKVSNFGFNPHDIYFAATHTHSSTGGWAQGYIGEIFAGTYHKKTTTILSKAILKSLENASFDLQKASFGYSAVHASDQVTNRLVGDAEGTIDPWLRFVKFQKEDGSVAILCSYSAHATCLSYTNSEISADYPGALCNTLEATEQISFVGFAAGAMASMAPLSAKKNGNDKIDDLATNLSEQLRLVQNFTPTSYDSILSAQRLKLELGAPQWRINKYFCIRPWVFNSLFDEQHSDITSLRIGNIVFIGVPFDFSGELVEPLELYARSKNLHIVITSFNGGYNGYVTKDQWYDRDHYETRVMNWYGPYLGSYISEMIKTQIDIYAENY